MSEWIKCSERMPEVLQIVWIFSAGKGAQSTGSYCGLDVLNGQHVWCGGADITHWMPLPEPPND